MSSDAFAILDQVEQALSPKRVDIQQFAEDYDFCNKPLYPRQVVLLKLIFLEEMTGPEEDILTCWINGGRGGNEITLSPDIRERRDFLRENGYKHFREVQLVGGRRSSKGFITGLCMAKVMWDTLQLGDPGSYYGIDKEKDIYFSCIAGSEAQAKQFQYADFVSTVETCRAFEPYLVKSLETEFRVATNADLRKTSAAKSRGSKIMRDIAKLRGNALAANAGTLRGSATMIGVMDEMAHMLPGESKASADQVYGALEPSMDQFGLDGMIFLNSSPYTKVGMFYECFEANMRPFDPSQPVVFTNPLDMDGDDVSVSNGNPRTFAFQFPSWAQFEGYRKYNSRYKKKARGKEFGKMITVSPDWNPEDLDADGDPLYSVEDKAGILQARAKEAANPETYKVERRGKFAEVTDAYLNPFMVDQMYKGIPEGFESLPNGDYVRRYAPLFTNNGAAASNLYRYKFHIDPSSTTAGFGFAVGHIEYFMDPQTGLEQEHVVFDMIKRWDPANFQGKVIRWKPILDELQTYASIFRPFEITFDQHQSAEPIQDLQERLSNRNIQCRVYEKVATAELNWKRWEVFKTALYQGLIHAPLDEYRNPSPMGSGTFTSADELKFLQQISTGGKYPKVDKQDIGPVQTKDMADPCHPSHEVLTIEGWRPIAEVTVDDLVASLAADGRMVYHHPEQTIERDVDTELFVYESKYIDFAVTGNHNMLVAQKGSEALERVEVRHLLHRERIPKLAILDRTGPTYFDVVARMAPVIPVIERKPVMYGHCQCGCGAYTEVAKRTRTGRGEFKGKPKAYIDRHSLKWTVEEDAYLRDVYPGESMEVIMQTLGKSRDAVYSRAWTFGLERGQIGDRIEDRPDPLPPCLTTDFAAFVGFWLGDGKKIKRNEGYAIRITQTKPKGIAWIDDLMSRMGWPYERTVCSNGETQWIVKSYELREYLYGLQEHGSHELRLPSEAWTEWGNGALKMLMEGLIQSDGCECADTSFFTNSSHALMEDVQRLALHIGRRGSPISLQHEAGQEVSIKGRTCNRNHHQYQVTVSDERPFADLWSRDIKREPYKGKVYCLTMPLGTFMTRRNGTPMWIGNCVAEVVYTLIGNMHITSMRERLAGSALAGGAPGGYGIGYSGPIGGQGPPGVSGYYSRREEKFGGSRSSLTQGALGFGRRGRGARRGRW